METQFSRTRLPRKPFLLAPAKQGSSRYRPHELQPWL